MKRLKSFILLCTIFMIATPLIAFGPGQQAAPVIGTVAETIESGGYRYVRLEEQGAWLAANAFDIAVGDKIQFSGGSEMKNFHSKSLDKTFESIFFVQNASRVGSGTAATVKGHGGQGMENKKPDIIQAPEAGDIKALEAGETVASIFSNAAGLKDQVVSLNARVVKVNKQIMGKNWVTLQDGTGTKPNNKLLATTQEEVSPGNLVVAKGKITQDVDLGYGYTYKVLLEDTSFTPGVE